MLLKIFLFLLPFFLSFLPSLLYFFPPSIPACLPCSLSLSLSFSHSLLPMGKLAHWSLKHHCSLKMISCIQHTSTEIKRRYISMVTASYCEWRMITDDFCPTVYFPEHWSDSKEYWGGEWNDIVLISSVYLWPRNGLCKGLWSRHSDWRY